MARLNLTCLFLLVVALSMLANATPLMLEKKGLLTTDEVEDVTLEKRTEGDLHVGKVFYSEFTASTHGGTTGCGYKYDDGFDFDGAAYVGVSGYQFPSYCGGQVVIKKPYFSKKNQYITATIIETTSGEADDMVASSKVMNALGHPNVTGSNIMWKFCGDDCYNGEF